MHKILNFNPNSSNVQVYTHNHKHNLNKHKTPIFMWFTTNEVATSTGTLSLLYSVKGIQSSYCTLLRSLSFSLSEPLRTKRQKRSLLSLSLINTLAYKICSTKRLMQGSGLMSIQNPNHKTFTTIYLSLYYLVLFIV